jgi:hypothetical protein
MRAIWHYPIGRGYNRLKMPLGSQVLGVQVVMNEIRIYASVDVDQPNQEARTFTTVGTGWEHPSNFKHIGTYQTDGGAFVWHVMEDVA